MEKNRKLNTDKKQEILTSIFGKKEYRQTKDIVYTKPTEVVHIIDLIEKYPNDADLGKEMRKYYLHIKNRVSL